MIINIFGRPYVKVTQKVLSDKHGAKNVTYNFWPHPKAIFYLETMVSFYYIVFIISYQFIF